MRNRASALVLLLHPAFLLLPALVLATIAVLTSSMLLGGLLALAVAVELTLAVSAVRRRRRAPVRAPDPQVVLTRADGHGRLWDVVDRLADAASVEPPARIVLSLADGAAVRPLVTDGSPSASAAAAAAHGTYDLVLSPVLLAESQVPQLTAVIAHELGYVAARTFSDRALAPRTAAAWIEPLDAAWPWGLFRLGSRLHLRLWRRVQDWATRPTELAADELAFRLAGPRTTAAALIRSDRMVAAGDLVADLYLPLARRAALRPSLLDAVRGVLDTSGDRLGAPVSGRPSRTPGRPAGGRDAAERIAAAEQASLDGCGVAADARSALTGAQASIDLIDGGREWLIAQESALLPVTHVLARAPRADWPTAVDVGWRAAIADSAGELAAAATTPRGSAGSLASPAGLGELTADQVTARNLLGAIDEQGSGAAGVARVLGEPLLDEDEALRVLVVIASRALDRAGRMRARLAWGHAPTPEYRDGTLWSPLQACAEDDLPGQRVGRPLDAALLAVSAGDTTARLLGALDALGADVDAPLATLAGEPTPTEQDLSCVAGVTLRREGTDVAGQWVALVDAGGIWLVPEAESAGTRAPDAARVQRVLIDRVARSYTHCDGPDLAAWPTSLWLPTGALAEIRVQRGRLLEVDLDERSGTRTTLCLSASPPSLGATPAGAFRALRATLLQLQ